MGSEAGYIIRGEGHSIYIKGDMEKKELSYLECPHPIPER